MITFFKVATFQNYFIKKLIIILKKLKKENKKKNKYQFPKSYMNVYTHTWYDIIWYIFLFIYNTTYMYDVNQGSENYVHV